MIIKHKMVGGFLQHYILHKRMTIFNQNDSEGKKYCHFEAHDELIQNSN